MSVNLTIESQDQVVSGMRMEEAELSGAGGIGRVRPGEYSLEVVNINTVTVISSEDTFLRSRAAPDCQCPLSEPSPVVPM